MNEPLRCCKAEASPSMTALCKLNDTVCSLERGVKSPVMKNDVSTGLDPSSPGRWLGSGWRWAEVKWEVSILSRRFEVVDGVDGVDGVDI